MLLFDFIPHVFKKEKWDQISDREKASHFFMLQRFASIRYPVQANIFNNLRINPSDAVDCWHNLFSVKYGPKVPGWIYAKTNKSKNEKTKKSTLLDATIKFYIEDRQLSLKEFKQLQAFHGEEFEKELLELQKILKAQDVIK